jgi:transcriptional regulator with XRE-family HTH domain
MGVLNEALTSVLKRKRRAFRFTQEDLGRKIGVSGSYISTLESGKASPRVSELEDLAACFRTTAMAMLEEAARAGERFVPAEAAALPGTLDTLAADLSPERRELAHEFLLFLRERERVDQAGDGEA